jgi:hypothetical protein
VSKSDLLIANTPKLPTAIACPMTDCILIVIRRASWWYFADYGELNFNKIFLIINDFRLT